MLYAGGWAGRVYGITRLAVLKIVRRLYGDVFFWMLAQPYT